MNLAPDLAMLTELGLGGGQELTRLYGQAVERAELSAVDFLTLRDLLELSGCADLELQALLLLMFMELNDGSLCLRLTEQNLEQKLRRLTGDRQPELAKKICAGLAGDAWAALISAEDEAYVPLIRKHLGRDHFLYFQKTWVHAKALREQLQRRLDAAVDCPGEMSDLASILAEVLSSQPAGPDGEMQELNREQQLALCLALLRRFVIISGGPGTGKTSIVFALLRCLVRTGLAAGDIRLAAPTGRAAQRMSESVQAALEALPGVAAAPDVELLQIKGHTVHRLLRYNPRTNGFIYNEHHLLPVKTVIIDEVSMVNVELMASLLSALPEDAQVIFLGDKDQLPPVEAGAVLASLVPSQYPESFSAKLRAKIAKLLPTLELPAPVASGHALTDRIVILPKSFRSDKQIIRVAKRINEQQTGAVNDFQQLPGTGKDLELPAPTCRGAFLAEISLDRPGPLHQVLDRWAMDQYLTAHNGRSYMELIKDCQGLDLSALPELPPPGLELLQAVFRYLGQAQILTFLREGPFGAAGINRYLDRQLRRVLDPGSRGTLFAGGPVMIQRNDYGKELFNGDLGVTLRDRSGAYRAVFARAGNYLGYAVDSLPPCSQAFAITVHKSQGSEYDRVLLVLPDSETHRLLSKEIVYTGLTRAKQLAVVCGAKAILAAAIRRHLERETGLSLWEEKDVDPDRPAGPSSVAGELPLFDA